MPKRRIGGKVTYFPMSAGAAAGYGQPTQGQAAGGGQAIPQILQQPPQVANTAQQASQANNANFSATDNAPYHQLYNGRQYYQRQTIDIDGQIAIGNYLSQGAEYGSMYSMSQNMNYAMANGMPLTANQQYVRDGLMGAMHNLGYNVYLNRYDHSQMINTLIQQAGLKGDYSNYTAAQLKSALVGASYTENRFLSTSYNDFKNANDPSTFTSRAVKITYQAKASTQAVMVGNGVDRYGRVDRQGEIVLAPNQNFVVKDVRYTGNTARKQGTQSFSLPQVEIVVEVG